MQKQILLKAASYCAYQERCHSEVVTRLGEWGVYGNEAQEILLKLIELGYVNEERFAKTFAGGKFRTKQWGKVKIKLELKQRHITEYCQRVALNEINDDDYLQTLTYMIEKKWATTLEKNIFNKCSKVARYAIAKGYESNLVWEVIGKIKAE